MVTQITLGEIVADVTLKDIKNVHLSVYPPAGHVRISAPDRMSVDTIRAYAVTKLDWIKRQQRKVRAQERETHRDFVDRESHYLWGKRLLLRVIEEDASPRVVGYSRRIDLFVRPGASRDKRSEVVDTWYREHLKVATAGIIKKWEPRLDVQVNRLFVQHMKTRWGSCSPKSANIRVNSELAKKPVECLEYIVVHEMVHLIERSHNSRFVALMNEHLPTWRFRRDELNRLPVRHEEWRY